MKCPICGTDIPFGSSNCPGCGNFVNQNSNNNYRTQYGNVPNNGMNNFNANQQFGYNAAQFRQMGSNSRNNTIAVIIALVVFVIVGLYMVFIKPAVKTKKYDFEYFSMELPNDIKSVSDSKFTSALSALQSINCVDAKEYESKEVRFAYCVLEGKGSDSLTTIWSPKMLISLFASSYNANGGYEEISKTDDSLKFKKKDGTKGKTYCQISLKETDSKLFVFFYVCNEGKQGKYEGKFEDWFDTFKEK